MKPILIVLALVTAHVGRAEQTNTPTRTGKDILIRVIEARRSIHPLLLANEHGKTPVLLMEPLQSPALRELFPRLMAFRLVSSRDIIHQAQCSALLVDTNGSPSHLQTDDEVAFFLGRLSENVHTKGDALRLIRAFADLRSYRIAESPPDFPDARKGDREPIPAPAETDYRFVAQERKEEWRVYATFFTSEHSSSYERYVFKIWKPPGGGITFSEPVLIRFRNYVY